MLGGFITEQNVPPWDEGGTQTVGGKPFCDSDLCQQLQGLTLSSMEIMENHGKPSLTDSQPQARYRAQSSGTSRSTHWMHLGKEANQNEI